MLPNCTDDMIPVQDLDMERAVLASMLIQKSATESACTVLKPSDFYRDAHRIVFRAIRGLYRQGVEVDFLSVQSALSDMGHLEEVGGAPFVIGLTDAIASTSNIDFYCARVIDASSRRGLAQAASQIRSAAYDREADVHQAVEEFVTEARALELRLAGDDPESDPRVAVDAWWAEKEDRANNGVPVGMLTGISMLDNMTLGIVKGQYWVIKGASSSGKTSLAVQIADAVSARGFNVYVDSHEMGRSELYDRITSLKYGVNLLALRSGQLDEDGWKAVSMTACELRDRPNLRIRDPKDAKVGSSIAAARRIDGLDLLVVDYIQRMDSDSASDNEVVKTQNISRQLANYAKHRGPAVLALSQQNDDGKTSWAASIKNDADVLLSIDADLKANVGEKVLDCRLIIEKQRNGPTGAVPVRFHRQYTRFAMREG